MKFFAGIVSLLRPKQWTKNAVCLAGAFFAGRFIDSHIVLRAVIATAAFCAASSTVYIVNDIMDREQDRRHPRKRHRQIASGAVSVPQAAALALVPAGVAVALSLSVGPGLLVILCIYAALNIAYSAGLKNLSLVDTTIIASGFILRIYAGTYAARVFPSAWILLCAFFLALYLDFSKRRAQISAATELGAAAPDTRAVHTTRTVLHKYRVPMLDRFCNICATLAIASYALFTILGHANRSFIITNPPVIMGVFRYIQLIERNREGEAPDTVLLKDWAIQLAILLWAVLYIAVLYFKLQIDVQ